MLAVASFWVDDAPTARLARERQFRGLRQAADDTGAARVAIALAWDATIFSSDPAVARGWAARARSLLADSALGEEHAWLALREASLADAGSEALAEIRELAEIVGAFDAQMTAAVFEGDALVAEGAVEQGLACMGEALAAACGDELEHPVAITFACCQLFGACGRVRDYEHAFQWCQRVAELCERRNIWSVLSATRCSYAAILIARGPLPRGRAPAGRRRVTLWRGGPASPPGACDRVAGRSAFPAGPARRGEPAARSAPVGSGAARHGGCRRARARAGRGRQRAHRHVSAPVRRLAGRPARGCARDPRPRGDPQRARERRPPRRWRAARKLAVKVKRAAVVGPSLVARAALDEHRGDVESARPALADAVELFEQGETPYEAAMTSLELARVLAAAGRTADAVRSRARGEERCASSAPKTRRRPC